MRIDLGVVRTIGWATRGDGVMVDGAFVKVLLTCEWWLYVSAAPMGLATDESGLMHTYT